MFYTIKHTGEVASSNPMEKEHILLLIILSFSFFVPKPIAGANTDCFPSSCGPTEPEVRFPFRISGRQPARCGFPGFNLSCDQQNRTIIRLPSSLSYIVNSISYFSQVISIDPEFCRPNRIVDVDITNTPFSYSTFWRQSYTFYNCTLQLQSFDQTYQGLPFRCLSTGNYSLMWFTPYCGSCERQGKACGLKSDDGQTICISPSRGIPRNAKYGLSIGIGVPALIGIIGLICYTSSRVQAHNESHNQRIDINSIAIIPQLASRTGLDGPTIESYPKTVLGESCRLPNDDATCAICLSDYKPKESFRTIPECNHYFHSECIDEWLKLNATCPVCRNSPESSALVTPCSSASSRLSSVDSS
ncbi:unnamed protein product [Lactuca saligna]|uniref:RING-type E3 ubiquitin transferase n=1 Tax=Lactuca saligna TaxID=75948 RepID=A0AA35ZAK7_LACSI|nr:unnamed protein product [Lactuca saligna]